MIPVRHAIRQYIADHARNEAVNVALLAVLGYKLYANFNKIVGELDQYLSKPSIDWDTAFRLGLNPRTLRTEYQAVPSNPMKSSNFQTHPLCIASCFLVNDEKQEAVSILEEYDLILEERATIASKGRRERATHDSPFGPSYGLQYMYLNNWDYTAPINTVSPLDYGLPLRSWNRQSDTVANMSWYDVESVEDIVRAAQSGDKVQFVNSILRTLGKDELEHRVQARAKLCAKDYVFNNNTRSSYVKAIPMLRLCSARDRREILDNVDSGVKRVVRCTTADCSKEDMVTALRAMSTASGALARDLVLEYLGRPPTVEEISKVRSRGIVGVLYRMPWVLLQETLKTGNLKGHLLRFSNEVDINELQDCLVDHDRRKKLRDTSFDYSKMTFQEYSEEMREARNQHFFMREEIPMVVGDLWELAFLAYLNKIVSRSEVAVHIKRIAETHDEWEPVVALVDSVPSPFFGARVLYV